MDILAYIVVGGFAGWLATKVMDEDWRFGVIGNIVIGVIGALLGSWLFSLITGGPVFTGFNFVSLLVALVGSVIALWLGKQLRW